MNKLKNTLILLIVLCTTIILVVMNKTSYAYYGATEAYRVYLNGNSLGLISSKEKLESYIDKEQQTVKQKYNVNQVYAPIGIQIKKEITYNKNIKKVETIYDEIKKENDFTIDGYIITIEKEQQVEEGKTEIVTETINVIDKEIFYKAIDSAILVFVDKDKYEAYLENRQQEIQPGKEGEIIENVYIKDEIKIKKGYIPANSLIFTNEKDLAKYLLFGTTQDSAKYTVKEGDTINSIAESNKMNTNEFLIANRDIKDENALLYEGQNVSISVTKPILTIVKETHKVEMQTIQYKTEKQEDPNMYTGYSEVIQNGENGSSLVTKKVQYANGYITSAYTTNTEVIKEPINKKVKVGIKTVYIVGSSGDWAWPTIGGYTISTYFGNDNSLGYYRFHAAIDIAGLGCGSPIYAANGGTVVTAQYQSSLGNHVTINHNNGFSTTYAHLSKIYVSVGEGVEMGDVIGKMGSTGYSTGCHLHFVVSKNGTKINPFLLY